MIANELLFLLDALIISSCALLVLRLGKEALVSFICITSLIANLFVIKQIPLCGLTTTCADAFTIGAVLGLNLLQEYYGKVITQRAIWISFVLLVFYAIVAYLHLLFIPATCDTTQTAFELILSPMPRIIAASLTTYLIVQHIDAWFYGQLKKYWAGSYLVLRNYICIGLAQLVDTILFSFLGLYGLVENIWSIIVISYAIKIVALLITTPALIISRQIKTSLK